MSTADSDAALLEAWAAGDNAEGNRLLDRYFDRLLAFFGLRVNRDVEDLVQRTMVSCLASRASVRKASSFRAFLFSVARNELIDHYRRKDPIGECIEPDDAQCERTTPSQFAVGRQQKHALAISLSKLEVELQIVLALYYWEGMTHAELTETLALPLGTVKSRLRRAKAALRDQMLTAANARDVDGTLQSLTSWARALRC
ncbi:MAG: sigma-70 family RNA polymerase sigma factor [Nannocystaceae bacterium]|nr:sigma-70 family RNA polymerase sigma factor [Nannocystaceae bacterium]